MYGLYPNNQARRLISIGFAAILVLMLVLGTFALVQLRAVNKGLDKVVAETNTKIASAYVMRDAIRQRSILLRNARISNDPFQRDEYAQDFIAIAGVYRQAREELYAMEMDENELRIHKKLTEIARESQPFNDRAMDYIIEEADEDVIDAEFAIAAAMQNNLLELLDDLIRLEEEYAEQAREKGQVNFRSTLFLMTVLTVLILAVGIAIAIYIVRLSNRITERFHYQASHDDMTGLINRREFKSRLAMALHTAKTERISHALLFLDLDEFKIVNDSGGHSAGDQMLKALPEVISSVVRKGDTVARLGGDEFGILLSDCDPDYAVLIANKVREAVAEFQFNWENKTFMVGASIGLVTIDEDSDDVNSLLRYADMACYAAKDQGKNRVYVFKFEDINIIRHHGHMQWASVLKEAIANNKLTIYLQPIKWSGAAKEKATFERYEALIRLKGEDGQIIEPRKFIPAAERYHMMPEVDRWVLEQVFDLCPEAEHGLKNNPLLTVNLSSDSLCNEAFIEFLEHKLLSHPLFANHLCFEIREDVVINKLQHMEQVILKLKQYGCKVSIDKFGAGISSLYYLKNLDIDYVKIEGAYVRNILSDDVNHELVSVVTDFCHKLGIDTIASFVEDDETFDEVRRLGVDYAQGVAIGKPLPCNKYLNPTLAADDADEESREA